MNELQALHVKSIARHILEHANSIVSRMKAIESIEEFDYSRIPVSMLLEGQLKDVTHSCEEIEQVLKDMLPNMPVQEKEQEFTGYGEDGPRFSSENGITTDNYPWLD